MNGQVEFTQDFCDYISIDEEINKYSNKKDERNELISPNINMNVLNSITDDNLIKLTN